MPAYAPYDEEQPPISPWATRDVYGNPLPIPDSYGIQDAPPYGFQRIQSPPLVGRPIQDAPPYGFIDPQEEDYYTSTNPALAGDKFAPYSEGSVAFSEPSDQGVRYPIATPAIEGRQVGTLGDITPDFQRALDEMAARDRQKQNPIYSQNDLSRIERNQIEDAGPNPAAIEQAIRLQGVLEYNNLKAQGVPDAEAHRQAAPKIYFNHPAAMASAMNHSVVDENPSITTIPVPGGNAILSNGRLHSVLKTPAEKVVPVPKVVVPPDIKELQANNRILVRDAVQNYNDKKKELRKATTPDDQSRFGREALAARDELERLMKVGVNLSTNYPNATPPASTNIVQKALTPPPAEDEMVPVTGPDGVRGRVPRSKLDAAIKQGYKER